MGYGTGASMKRFETNDTFKVKYINSGTTPDDAPYAALYGGSGEVVSSASMVASGNGHFYCLMYVNTPGYYVVESKAVVANNPYTKREIIEVVITEVD